MQRAQETAAPIAAELGQAPTLLPALNEIDFGSWSGMAFDALAAEPGSAAWNLARSRPPRGGGACL